MIELFADEEERFLKEWQQPTPPNLTTTHNAVRNRPVVLMIVLGGCAANAQGNCDVVGDIRITDPNGKVYGDFHGVDIYQTPASPSVLVLSASSIGLRVETGEALGRYKIALTATDRVAGKSLNVYDYVDVAEAPITPR